MEFKRIATVTFTDGEERYTSFSTASDYCNGILSDDINAVSEERENFDDCEYGLEIANVSVQGYNDWVCLTTKLNIISPLSPFGTENVCEKFEGVLVDDLIHLRNAGGQGMMLCELELSKPPSKKLIFEESLQYQSMFNQHEYSNESPYTLAQRGKVCLICLNADEVRKEANN